MQTVDKLSIRKAGNDDLELLYAICRQCYTENFADHWQPGGLANYLDRVYGLEPIRADLSNHKINYFIAFANDEPIGFMKVHLSSSLPKSADVDTTILMDDEMEIEKIYFLRKHQGKGFGKQLMNMALDLAGRLNKKIVWLGVLDTNESSIAFYEKQGFKKHSSLRLDIPYLKDELRGMWRMYVNIKT